MGQWLTRCFGVSDPFQQESKTKLIIKKDESDKKDNNKIDEDAKKQQEESQKKHLKQKSNEKIIKIAESPYKTPIKVIEEPIPLKKVPSDKKEEKEGPQRSNYLKYIYFIIKFIFWKISLS